MTSQVTNNGQHFITSEIGEGNVLVNGAGNLGSVVCEKIFYVISTRESTCKQALTYNYFCLN